MAENNIAVQKADVAPKLMLNGVEATAQQVYDAFMAGPVRLANGGILLAPLAIYWENSDGTQTNPKAVTYVEIRLGYAIDDSSLIMGEILSIGAKYVAES